MEHHKHPAKPERGDSFEKGVDRKPDPPEEDLEPDFARGVREGEPGEEGRFSEGAEELPDSPEKHVEGRFSEGAEELPDSPEKHVERRFSEGIERSPTSE
jgi:hypothetical protein